MNPIYKFNLNRASSNLLNPDTLTEGYRINESTGGLLATSTYKTSDYMVVEPGGVYGTRYKDNTIFQMQYFALYDADKTFISGYASVSQVVAPANAVYARLSIPTIQDAWDWYFGIITDNYSQFISPLVHPVYGNDLSVDWTKEGGEEFFRRKLSGELTFIGDDYSWIVSQAFDYEFKLTIFISYDGGSSWSEYWKGKFYKTDCAFNDDDQSVSVEPMLDDGYAPVIAGLEKEYDLIKLAPAIEQIKYDKRPMLQFYVPGTSVVGCYLRGMWWEQECEESQDWNRLTSVCQFYLTKDMTIAELTQTGTPVIPRSMFVASPQGAWDNGYTLAAQGYELVITPLGGGSFGLTIQDTLTQTAYWYATIAQSPTPNFSATLNPVVGSGATGTVEVYVRLFQVLSRLVTDIPNASTSAIDDEDIVSDMRNYHYVMPIDYPSSVVFNSYLSDSPTEYGMYEKGYYYSRPNVSCVPLSRNLWTTFSVWLDKSQIPDSVDEDNRRTMILRDAYSLPSVISVLLGEFAPNITHKGIPAYSRFLYQETDPLTSATHNLYLCPKSNILTAGYDQPAQTAKITLRAVLDMLRDCFRCYWFIDEQNRFRIEHIEFFRRGGSYSVLPDSGIDLTTGYVTRNGKPWAFGRNQYDFSKPEMAERYQFGWMDDVTEQFEGQPIEIVSGYVEPGKIENISPSMFTSDVDYMLLNPAACSREGFALLSAVPNTIVCDYDNYNKLDLGIIQSGVWGSTTTDKHIAIPIVGGSKIVVVADGTENAEIAWLTSDAVGGAGTTPPYVSGTSLIVQDAGTTGEYIAPDGAMFLYVYFGAASSYPNKPTSVSLLEDYSLPYVNIAGGVLQNGLLSWPYLQIYYDWDMPALYYKIGNVQYTATGVKKLKTQSLNFPALYDPDVQKLIKTFLGEGKIEKLSINLSSRGAKATLKYDTE